MLSTQSTDQLEALLYLTPENVSRLTQQYGTPLYVYSEQVLTDQARAALAFNAPFGLTVRYAMKANPLSAILGLFDNLGLHVDASSGYEADRAISAGIKPDHIMVTSQEFPTNIDHLVAQGVKYNATSLNQLERYGQRFPGSSLAIRVNAGLGSGHRPKVSVAGPSASFGIWHEHLDKAKAAIAKHRLVVDTLHSHIGCGSDPAVWHQVSKLTLNIVRELPEVSTLNLGGGFKVARMSYETPTDMAALSEEVAKEITEFAWQTKRQLKLEIEPGTYLTANAGSLIAAVQDLSDTGSTGFNFIKLNAGMNDVMRPALYGSQHPIIVINNREPSPTPYVVVGHNCESSDLLTPAPDNPDIPHPRLLQKAAFGDAVVIEGVGAYCSAMRFNGYNSFPSPAEVMLLANGETKLINHAQNLRDFTHTEVGN